MRPTALNPIVAASQKVRILFIEDSADDLELCLRELRKSGFDTSFDSAQTPTGFTEKLANGDWDVIVADYRLTGWTGVDAIKLLRKQGKNIPVILVTGVLGEELAVDCIKQGVSDYVLKDRLARLPVAISQALQQAKLEEQRNQAASSRESDALFRTLAESIDSAILVYVGSRCRYVNQQAESPRDIPPRTAHMNSLSFIDPASRDSVIRIGFRTQGIERTPRRSEVKILTKSGETRSIDLTSTVIDVDGKRGRLVTAFDITEHKNEKEEMRRLATIDSLTGLRNYRGLIHAFDNEVARWGRVGILFRVSDLDD